MSFASFQEVCPPSVVNHCAEVVFHDTTHVCTVSGNLLELYVLLPDSDPHLQYRWSTHLHGKVEALTVLRGRATPRDDHICVLFKPAYVAIFEFDTSSNALRCAGSYAMDKASLDDAYVARGPPLHRVDIDPAMRCIGVQIETASLFVFPCVDTSDQVSHERQHQRAPSSFCVPSSTGNTNLIVPDPGVLCMRRDLKLHSLDDWVFLLGYENTFPTLVCCGKTEPAWAGRIRVKELTGSLLVVALDIKQNISPHILWTSRTFYDTWRLVPLIAPVHGVLVVCSNAVFYVREHGETMCQTVNESAGDTGELDLIIKEGSIPIQDSSFLSLNLSGCSVLPINAEVIFVQCGPGAREGEVFLVHVVTTSGGGTGQVENFVWKSLGTAPACSTLCRLGETFLFLASSHMGSSLLRLDERRNVLGLKELPRVKNAKQELMTTEQQRALTLFHSKMRMESKYAPTFTVNVVDELPSLGPLSKLSRFTPEKPDEDDEEVDEKAWAGDLFASSSGFGSRGATYIASARVPFDSISNFEVEERSLVLNKVWTCGGSSNKRASSNANAPTSHVSHEFAILSGKGKTMVLRTTDEIEEVDTHLCTTTQTLACGVYNGVRQVTMDGVYFMNRDHVTWPNGVKLQKAAMSENIVAGVDYMGRPHVFAVELSGATEITKNLHGLGSVGFTNVSFFKGFVLWVANGDLTVYNPREARGALFKTERVDCAPCLIVHGPHMFRTLTDISAKPAAKDMNLPDALTDVLDVRLMELDAADVGPTLVLLLSGRPVLVYRSFIDPARRGHPFPYSFHLVEHRFIESISEGTITPWSNKGLSGCYVTRGGAFPSLWLFAARNILRVHLCSLRTTLAIAPFNAECTDDVSRPAFFTIRRSKRVSEAHIVSFAAHAGGAALDLKSYPFPVTRFSHLSTPHMAAIHPRLPYVAVVFVKMQSEPFNIVTAKGEDEDETVEKPPVDEAQPKHPRAQKCFSMTVYYLRSDGMDELGSYVFESEQHVLALEWVVDVPGLDHGALLVGTGLSNGEDLPCKGEFLVFAVNKEEPVETLVPTGLTKCDKQHGMRGPVTCVGSYDNYLMFSCGHRVSLNKWDGSMPHQEKRVVLVAFYDAKFCVTSMNRVKNYFLIGDVRKGLEFCRWREDPSSDVRKFETLSRSQSTFPLSVLSTGVMVDKRVLGLVVMDHLGNCHLFQYHPNSDGREGDAILWSCASFHIGGVCRSLLLCENTVLGADMQGRRSLLCGAHNGALFSLVPTDDQTYRTVTTLCGVMTQRLPFCGGLNPRAYRQPQDTVYATHGTTRKNIEDASLVRSFCFAHACLQDQIADRMQMPLRKLLKVVEPCAVALI